MRRMICSALLALGALYGVPSANAAVTYNDLWWLPSESGWGFNIAQQGDTLFLTFFVYGQDSKPTWLTAQLAKTGQSPSGQPIYTGNTYITSGPWFGGAFNSASVTVRQAGTATFAPNDATSAALTYSVDGVNVTKNIQRQTLVSENFTGSYSSLWRFSVTCPGIGTTTQQINYSGSIAQSAGQFQYTRVNPNNAADTCTLSGAWTQQGALGHADGNVACSDGTAGTFSLSQVASNAGGFTGQYAATLKGPTTAGLTCTLSGTVTALRL